MLSKNPTIVLVLGFIAGCGAAAIAPLVIPPAHAQVTQRWETLCVTQLQRRDSPLAEGTTALGNQAGREGWELVSFSIDSSSIKAVACFKRPAP